MLSQFYNRILLFTVVGLLLGTVIGGMIYVIWSDEQAPSLTMETLESETITVFEPVLPGDSVVFPKDFKIHSIYQHEAWRFVAMLNDEEGNDYLVQWYLYRVSMSEHPGVGWESPQIYHTQAIVTTADEIVKEERFARGGIGLVGMRKRPYQLAIDNWSWRSFSGFPMPGRLDIKADTFEMTLGVQQNGTYIPLGDDGYQVTHELLSRSLYGYLAPFIKTEGVLKINGKEIKVQGHAWLNHIWGTDLLGKEQAGFNLFLYRFEDGRVLSVVRTLHEQHEPYLYGTLAFPNGAVRKLDHTEIEMHSVGTRKISNGKRLPLKWVVNIPKYKIFLISNPNRIEQWMDLSIPSWSGTVEATGSDRVSGFMQLVGY